MPFKSASFDIAEDSQIHCGAAPRLSFKEYDIDPLSKMGRLLSGRAAKRRTHC